MGIEEIRKNAPLGATHYYSTSYYAIDHNGVWKFDNPTRSWRSFNYGNKEKLKPL